MSVSSWARISSSLTSGSVLLTGIVYCAGASPAVFEPGDAYYIPFHGFAGVRRPGPLIRIYELEPPATR